MDKNNSAEKEWLKRMMESQAKFAPPAGEIVIQDTPGLKQKEEPEEVEVPSEDGKGLGGVAGMENLKRMITDSFINVLKNKECASVYGIKPPSMLFYGPAGCGKTFFAEKMAEEIGINFMKVVPDDIACTWIHGTQQKIGELFRKAEKEGPTIIFFDEFDAMVPQRSSEEGSQHMNGEVNEFLCMLNNASEKGVYVIAATNHPEHIDRAVLRSGRIDEMIYISMPDMEARENLFRLELSKLPADDNLDYSRLAGLTEGYNCSDISYIVKIAARKAFNETIRNNGKTYMKISQDVLEESIAGKAPSVNIMDLQEYERVHSEFSGRKEESAKPKRIGFKQL